MIIAYSPKDGPFSRDVARRLGTDERIDGVTFGMEFRDARKRHTRSTIIVVASIMLHMSIDDVCNHVPP